MNHDYKNKMSIGRQTRTYTLYLRRFAGMAGVNIKLETNFKP
jgi:hypothetical protein